MSFQAGSRRRDVPSCIMWCGGDGGERQGEKPRRIMLWLDKADRGRGG